MFTNNCNYKKLLMSIYIETERLILREFEDRDTDALFTLDSDALVHKYLGNKPVKKREESFKYIQDCKIKYTLHGMCRLAVIIKKTNTFIGWSGLRFIKDFEFNNHINFYDVGYRLMPQFWNKGFATESGKASVNYGFNTLNLDTIYGITEIGNNASHNALLKIGLTHIENFTYLEDKTILRWYKIENN